MSEAARYVEQLLGYQKVSTVPDPGDFDVAVGKLVNDGMDRPVAVTLIEAARGRRQDVCAWADHIVRLRVEYRRKLAEVRS